MVEGEGKGGMFTRTRRKRHKEVYSRQVKAQGMLLGVGSFIHHRCRTNTARIQFYHRKRTMVCTRTATATRTHIQQQYSCITENEP